MYTTAASPFALYGPIPVVLHVQVLLDSDWNPAMVCSVHQVLDRCCVLRRQRVLL